MDIGRFGNVEDFQLISVGNNQEDLTFHSMEDSKHASKAISIDLDSLFLSTVENMKKYFKIY